LELYININRFHPLLVHLPIGILMLALLMEILQWWTKRTDLKSAISISLNVSLLASLFAVGTGWFLAEEGGYDADLLFWHKWMGIGMTLILALICVLRWKERERGGAFWRKYYTWRRLFIYLRGGGGSGLGRYTGSGGLRQNYSADPKTKMCVLPQSFKKERRTVNGDD